MLVGVGTPRRPDTLEGRLLDCHDRIRRFSALACRLSEEVDVPEQEVSEAAHQIRRYFSEALPLHVLDEEESLLPRLRGRAAELDAALERMHDEHEEHGPDIERLISLCTTLEQTPQRLPELREALAQTAVALERALQAHLEEEERVVFAGIERWLDAATCEEIAREMSGRRTR